MRRRTFCAAALRDRLGPRRYVEMQRSGDEGYAAGRGYYERSGFVRRLEPALIDAVVAQMEVPHPQNAGIDFVHQGGAIARMNANVPPSKQSRTRAPNSQPGGVS